jgi:sulfur transfer protein SufE
VWVKPELQADGTLQWRADSDSQLTKGLAALLVMGLSGCRPEEILKARCSRRPLRVCWGPRWAGDGRPARGGARRTPAPTLLAARCLARGPAALPNFACPPRAAARSDLIPPKQQQPPRSLAAQVEPDFIEMLGLKQSLTPSRNNGFLNMFLLMKRKSAALAAATASAAAAASGAPPASGQGQ